MEINLIVQRVQDKISEDREESFWYNGDIAYVNLLSGNKMYLEANGEIRVCFEEDADQSFKDDEAREEALDRGLTDKDLRKIDEHDGFGNNNWFEIVKVDAEGNLIDEGWDVCFDYDEGITALLDIAYQEHNKEYS